MQRFEEDDRVRVDIPDTSDPDHSMYHGEHGVIVEIFEDDAALVTGDDRDSQVYRVELDSGKTVDFRHYDLRKPIE